MTVFGTSFNFPPGDITVLQSTLTGALADGSPISVDFGRASTATITLRDLGRLDILRVDQTGSVIAYANIDDFITNQNGMVLGPPVSDFTTARGFFSVAGKFYAVLGDGTIVQYSTALDFANDFNGTEIGTVAEYASDVGFLGATPIPIIPAPALHGWSLLILMIFLLGAGFISLLILAPRAVGKSAQEEP